MSIHLSPRFEIKSNCTACCPRFIRIWFCCCCTLDPSETPKVDEVAKRTWEHHHSHHSDKHHHSHK